MIKLVRMEKTNKKFKEEWNDCPTMRLKDE